MFLRVLIEGRMEEWKDGIVENWNNGIME